MSGYLELPDGAFIGVRDGLVLGRVSACDVVVQDSKASRRHARLIVEAGVVEIEDMNSSNGTLLNGKPVERRMMRDGDEVRIGKTVIVYREGSMPGAGASRSASSSGGGGIFDDDDDLFADSSSSSTPADSARPTPPSEPEPELIQPRSQKQAEAPEKPADPPKPIEPEPVKPANDDPFGDDDLLGGDDLGSDPEPPQAPAANVVEFEDEVVEVQQPAPKAPEPVRRPAEPVVEVRKSEPSASPRGAGAAKPASDDVVGTSGRILQYSKKSSGKNPLGDDLGQMSGGMRLLVVIAGLAIGGGIIYGILIAMQ